MTNFTNLTASFSSFYGVNPQETKLTFSKVFDFFNPYHHKAFKGLTEPLKMRLYRGVDYFDLELLDSLAWALVDNYELERQLEDNYIDRKIKEKILLDNDLLDEYQALKDEVFKNEDSRNDYFESVALDDYENLQHVAAQEEQDYDYEEMMEIQASSIDFERGGNF